MAPVIHTYGTRKRKRLWLPKHISCSASDDPFEVLNISKIKEMQALQIVKKTKKPSKTAGVEKPTLDLSKDADSTFDKLLKCGPINSIFSSNEPTAASAKSSKYCNKQVKVNGPWRLPPVKSDCLSGAGLKVGAHKKRNSQKSVHFDSFFYPSNESDNSVLGVSNVSPIHSVSEKERKIEPISPIYRPLFRNRIASCSTPTERFWSQLFPLTCDVSSLLTDNDGPPNNEKHDSVDLFSSYDKQNIVQNKDSNESLDLFRSCGSNSAGGWNAAGLHCNPHPRPSPPGHKSVSVSPDPKCDVNKSSYISVTDSGNLDLSLSLQSQHNIVTSSVCENEVAAIDSRGNSSLDKYETSDQPVDNLALYGTGFKISSSDSPLNDSVVIEDLVRHDKKIFDYDFSRECRILLEKCDRQVPMPQGADVQKSPEDCVVAKKAISFIERISGDTDTSILSGARCHSRNGLLRDQTICQVSRCESVTISSELKYSEPELEAVESGKWTETKLRQSLVASPLMVSNPRKSSFTKKISQDPVILRPGKHWRRSMSILVKVRSSLGEVSSDVREPLNITNRVKGKRWESAVNSILQLQSTSDVIFEDLEDCNEVSNQLQIERISEKCDAISLESSETYAIDLFSLCGQEGPVPFAELYPSSMKKYCKKIGEGVYGEVFSHSGSARQPKSVIKIIPIEGSMEINGEPQKSFKEVLSEVRVAVELSNLRRGSVNVAQTFNEVKAVHCVKGSYPLWLQDLWNEFNDIKGSENDSPEVFSEDQLFVVLVLAHGGQDLESFVFTSADQGLAALKQVALTLAVGESALKFEHRDLHWGNILLSDTKEKKINFILNGQNVSTPSKGIEVSIIDFTLSRISDPVTGRFIFYDLSKDETLFNAYGDYQFEVYRIMKDYCGNMWSTFAPRTNIVWLHYVLDKLCTMARYKNRSSKIHSQALNTLSKMRDTILTFSDATSFVKSFL